MSSRGRLLLLALVVAAAAVAAAFLPLSRVPGAIAGLGPAAPVVGTVVGVLLLAALVPRTPVSLACGALLGPVTGSVVAMVAMALAATITFVAGRALGQDYLRRRLGDGRWETLSRWTRQDGILTVAAVRAVPLGPYGLMGYIYGASPVRVRDFALGSLLAGTPSAVTYALLGAAVVDPGGVTPWLYLPLGLGLVLAAVVIVRARRRLGEARR